MRLCNIKLSGFKSFVDPTNLIIPGNLVGIVGPNGCGKSNIIDAVTWVMGESSAKHLRGEALTDVIFSGSGARQPVGQAAVELVFDNTEQKLGGQYAAYSQISVKRQINRDGVSVYYLNGTRCRRRDITAIFLGTGLGPRSYAIIEQGMISRLIEARPEELRAFIEEAAGISKYRERRRETENRIRHTRENIDRLTDIRAELEKQLNHLRRQARAAERYKLLKQQERKLQYELLALDWRALDGELGRLQETAAKRETAAQAALAEVRKIEAGIEKERERLDEANRLFNNRQSEYYRVGSDISRYEQKLHYSREKVSALEADIEKEKRNSADILEQQRQDSAEHESLGRELSELQPKLQAARDESDKAHEQLSRAEQAMHDWQAEWDQFNTAFSEFKQQTQVDHTRLEHLRFGLDELTERRLQLEGHIAKFESSALEEKAATLAEALAGAEAQQAAINAASAEKQAAVRQCRATVKHRSADLGEARERFQAAKGRLVSLETLQRAVMQDNRELHNWLAENGLDNKQRLSQVLKVSAKWTHALETVTRAHLRHICVAKPGDYLDRLDTAPGKFGLISSASPTPAAPRKDYPRLIDEISATIRIPFLLQGIYLADSLAEAIKMLPDLGAAESVVTAGGVWLSHNWVIVNNASETDGVLNREQEITALKAELAEREQHIDTGQAELKQAEAELERAEAALHEQQQRLHEQQQTLSDIRSRLAAAKAEAGHAAGRHEQWQEELETSQTQAETDRAEIDAIEQRLAQVQKDRLELEQKRAGLSAVNEQHRAALKTARGHWQDTHTRGHDIALKCESCRSRLGAAAEASKRNERQLAETRARLAGLEQNLAEQQAPIQQLQLDIEKRLQDKLAAEKSLGEARARLQTIETASRALAQDRHKFEQTLDGSRAELEKAKLAVNGCRVKLDTVQGQLSALEKTPREVLQTLPEDAGQDDWTRQLEATAAKIQRLGPVNLAAIDEHSQSAERKTYLDSQHDDLMEALKTLETAIRKIDKETRARFKATFDQLNTNIRDMFPKLFGGGQAYLELTGDDLLQTGVTLMARPPGKKNSNIHLLSGGEKALTAVALVLAIFKLNPAPFCILDEVDAPLDDANIGRFSELIKAMSADVQFIFVTHNKITMELAQQLLGVTMYEAGVSRLVSVDVDAAVEMAAPA